MEEKYQISGFQVFLIMCLIFCCIGFAGFKFWVASVQPMGDGQEITVEVEEGESMDEILQKLEDEDLISSSLFAKVYIKIFGSGTVYAGEYTLNDGMSLQEVIAYLSKQENGLQKDWSADSNILTIPEGAWAKQVAASIESLYPEYKAEEVLAKWNDQDYIEELAETYAFIVPENLTNPDLKVKLEGYLYPETYYLEKDADIDTITRRILDEFNSSVYKPLKLDVEESDYTFEEILSLASVVQFEASSVKDMKTIAGIFYNRLEQGMMLQSSVTVCYALYDDFTDAMSCEVNTDIDSPYNTYLHEGIPIGPILNPGKQAIDAVLNPENNDYLFFAADIYGVSEENPYGVFYSKTLEEHEAICQQLGLFQ